MGRTCPCLGIHRAPAFHLALLLAGASSCSEKPASTAGTEPNAADYARRAEDCLEKRDYDGAIEAYSEAIELKPDVGRTYLARGYASWLKGNHDLAVADYTRAVRLCPDLADAYLHRGLAHLDKGNLDSAIPDLTRAIELARRANQISQRLVQGLHLVFGTELYSVVQSVGFRLSYQISNSRRGN